MKKITFIFLYVIGIPFLAVLLIICNGESKKYLGRSAEQWADQYYEISDKFDDLKSDYKECIHAASCYMDRMDEINTAINEAHIDGYGYALGNIYEYANFCQ